MINDCFHVLSQHAKHEKEVDRGEKKPRVVLTTPQVDTVTGVLQ